MVGLWSNAIPIGLTIDFYGLEHGGRQAEAMASGVMSRFLNTGSGGGDVCRGDEKLDGRFCQPFEIDFFCEDIPQRIPSAQVDVVG